MISQPKELLAPRIPLLKLSHIHEGDPSELVAEARVDGQRFVNADTEGDDLSFIEFLETELDQWRAGETKLLGAE